MPSETKTALVIIDVQKDYFPGGNWELEGAELAGERAGQALAQARKRGLAVIHIRHEAPEGFPFLAAGTRGAEIHPCVAPREGEALIRKSRPNSFLGTNLQEELDGAGIKHLVVVGMMTNNCVDATVRGAVESGYSCTVLHDACAAMAFEFQGESLPAPLVQAVFMAELAFAYGTVLGVGQWLDPIQEEGQ
ncbi:MAG: cysteine hydrolase [Proteobacteria bacterium]|nr:cysteine hydrolase [Pseudomonadota bacterium]